MNEIIDGSKIIFAVSKIAMEQNLFPILSLFLAGVIGALLKDILEDNAIVLPKVIDGKMTLGFIGGAIVGGLAGYYVDGSLVTAGMGGYAGKSIIEALLSSKKELEQVTQAAQKPISETEKKTIEQRIREIAKEKCVDPELAVRVAKCESALNPSARNVNKTGSVDRGLYQWNNLYHPEITDAMAYDPDVATREFCKAVKAGNLSWWNASKTCWNR